MNTKLIKRVSLFAVLSSLIGAVALAPASQAASTSRYITISADGTVKVAPDAVRINATATALAATTKEALSQTASAAAAVRATLLAQGVATKDIATQSVSIYPEYTYTTDKGQVLSGYRANQSFVIVIRKASSAGLVVDAIVTAGGDNLQLNGVTPFVLDSTKAIVAARTAAVKNAKAKALSYTSLLGVKLGRVNYLIENSSPVSYPPMFTASKDSAGTTQIDLGLQDVTVSIAVQWSLL